MIKEYKGFKIRVDLISISGSHLYGNSTESSDYDYRGIFTVEINKKNGFIDYPTRISDPEWTEELSDEFNLGLKDFSDVELFEMGDFFKLAMGCNPNIMDVLFTDEDAILYISEEGKKLISNNKIFLSKKIKHTFSGYAMSQLKRIKGHNKWYTKYPEVNKIIDFIKGARNMGEINKHWISNYFSGNLSSFIEETEGKNTTNKKLLSIEDFEKRVAQYEPSIDLALYERRRLNDYIKPYSLSNTLINSSDIVDDIVDFSISKENGSGLTIKQFLQTKASFRKLNENIIIVYSNGNGIFGAEGNLKSNDSEVIGRFVCLAKIDYFNYKKENDDIQKMWDWRTHRNEKRSELEKKFGYDTKHASHLARLMKGCENILTNNDYHPRLKGDDLNLIKDIRAGKYDYDWIINYASEMDSKLNTYMQTSALRDKCKINEVSKLYKELEFKGN